MPSGAPYTSNGTNLCNPSKWADLWLRDGTIMAYLICGILHRYGADISNPAKWPDFWQDDVTYHSYLLFYSWQRFGTDLSVPVGDLRPDDETYNAYQAVALTQGLRLTSAIQPVTSDHEMGWISPCIRPSSPLWIPKGWLPEKMQFLQRKWVHRIKT